MATQRFDERFRTLFGERDPSFAFRGAIVGDGEVLPATDDSKVLGWLFEAIAEPTIIEAATGIGRRTRPASTSKTYPDYTLLCDEVDPAKIAVDVKSTVRQFRADGSWSAVFTLGSFTSYLQPGKETKNIEFPYGEYGEHWVIGFIYTRTSDLPKGDPRKECGLPFVDVEWFVQEKHLVAGEYAGSGNTRNMGSFRGESIEAFQNGEGPFRDLGHEVFEDYYRNLNPKTKKPYTDLAGYLRWRNRRAGEPYPACRLTESQIGLFELA